MHHSFAPELPHEGWQYKITYDGGDKWDGHYECRLTQSQRTAGECGIIFL